MMIEVMMQSLGINPEDVEQLKKLARTVNELPDRITTLEARMCELECTVIKAHPEQFETEVLIEEK